MGRALKNGCPILVEPYGNDQFYNAKRVLELAVGAAAHPFRSNARSIARLLEERVLTRACKRNAETLKERMAGEDGLRTACDHIENIMGL